jgi:hypothetical protein
MGNRKYHQVDEGTYVPFAQPDQLIPAVHRPIWTPPNQERLDSLKLFDRIQHRVTAGHKDPISVLQVIDILQRWNPDFYVRSKYVARGINEKQIKMYFEPITVGKILAEFSDVANEEWAHRPELCPITPIMDYKGVGFLLTNNIQTYQWFWQLRESMIEKCHLIQEDEARGITAKRFVSAWDGVNTKATV